MGKRELNKQLVRERLLKEAMGLFATKGFEQTTVADIVEAAEIGRGTFYNYFPDVKAIFSAVIDDMNLQLQVLTEEAKKEGTNLYELLFISFKTYFDFVSGTKLLKDFHLKNFEYIRSNSYSSDTLKQVMSDLRKDLKARKAMSDFKEDYEFQLLSMMLIGSPVELFLTFLKSDAKISNDEMAAFLAKLFRKVLKN